MKELLILGCFFGLAAGGYFVAERVGRILQKNHRATTSDAAYYEDIDEDTKEVEARRK